MTIASRFRFAALGAGLMWLFDPQKGEPFNFRKVYQTVQQTAPDKRQFRGQEIVTGRRGTWPPASPL